MTFVSYYMYVRRYWKWFVYVTTYLYLYYERVLEKGRFIKIVILLFVLNSKEIVILQFIVRFENLVLFQIKCFKILSFSQSLHPK